MRYKCKQCKVESDYLHVEVVNLVQYSTVYIPEEYTEGDDLFFGDFDTNYDDSKDIYTCPECGYELPMNDEEALLKYLKENQ
jgi:DNA-directed RNA polymerase subunit RPC12/RpoP